MTTEALCTAGCTWKRANPELECSCRAARRIRAKAAKAAAGTAAPTPEKKPIPRWLRPGEPG